MYNKENLADVSQYIMSTLAERNSGITQEQFYSQNLVDTTDVSEDDMREVNEAVIEFCAENGCYAALPPFEEGSFVDREERRYTHWKVLDVQEDYFRIEFNHYPIIYIDNEYDRMIERGLSAQLTHPCWYRSCRTVVKVKVVTPEEHIAMLSYHPDFDTIYGKVYGKQVSPDTMKRLSDYLRTKDHVGGVLEDYEYYHAHDLKKILKKGKYYTPDGRMLNGNWVKTVVNDSLAYSSEASLRTMLYCSLGPIIEMFIYINYMLSRKSTGSSTLRKITSIYAPSTDAPEIRKERHFGKLKVVSVKKPRSINVHNIQRIYTTMTWQRRSHVRHLASGKVVPVKSAICKRRNSEDTTAPQVVYKA